MSVSDGAGGNPNCCAGPGDAGVTAMHGLSSRIGRPMSGGIALWGRGRGVEWERPGIASGVQRGLGSAGPLWRWDAKARKGSRELAGESERDVAGDWADEGVGEKEKRSATLSPSRPSLLAGDGCVLARLGARKGGCWCWCWCWGRVSEGPPRAARRSVAPLSPSSPPSVSGLGSGGSGRLRRSASDCVPAFGNTGGGAAAHSDGLLAFGCANTTGEIGESSPCGDDGVDDGRGAGAM